MTAKLKDTPPSYTHVGADVLTQEAAALSNLASSLGDDFARAVELIQHAKGRVIVTGMGKSGHIGAKIAATLASTGTPAFFVHPGEASHGDLGMVTREDVVIGISHSGETKELADILAYCARFNVPLIALTGKPASALGSAADVALINGVTKEACPLNLAPTTSTTATLALGDALAVTLMHARGFKPEDFANFHPGGKLGAQLLKVKDIMVKGKDLPLVAEHTPMREALLEITGKSLGLVGVVGEQGQLCGVITDGDLRRHMNDGLLDIAARDIMSTGPLTTRPDMLASAAVALMQDNDKKRNITALFVMDGNKPVGVIHIHHCLRAGVV